MDSSIIDFFNEKVNSGNSSSSFLETFQLLKCNNPKICSLIMTFNVYFIVSIVIFLILVVIILILCFRLKGLKTLQDCSKNVKIQNSQSDYLLDLSTRKKSKSSIGLFRKKIEYQIHKINPDEVDNELKKAIEKRKILENSNSVISSDDVYMIEYPNTQI
ncbi:unnamed protein product [Brachionus calyciflorus]|uniref:Uncharacterized protein n=1 Tax=Brachionus calyciflorus TaxID=104777 RepID=A0A813M3B2_9BILA|nr:unnamed protein product [Brachionus calyciflorus]